MSSWREDLSDAARDRLRRKSMPRWTEPMLATLTDERFSSPDWIFERKLDGERCLAFREPGGVRLCSRNGKALNDTYPELVEALERGAPERFIVDGEIVAFEGKLTSFSRLQGRLGIRDREQARRSGIKVYFYLFDLLYLDDSDVTGLALRDRKRLLRQIFTYRDPIRFSAHRNEHGEKLYADACDKGWEGIIAKRADGRYVHGRSRDWLKFKCVERQELVIGGYTDPKGSRIGFGALLLGYYEDDALCYAGRVGTGFDDETLERLHERLSALEQDEPAYADPPAARKGVHWVAPDLVAEIGFTEWTRDGGLRHPRFIGLRRDKPPREVVREAPS